MGIKAQWAKLFFSSLVDSWSLDCSQGIPDVYIVTGNADYMKIFNSQFAVKLKVKLSDNNGGGFHKGMIISWRLVVEAVLLISIQKVGSKQRTICK